MVRENLFDTIARKEKTLWILQCFGLFFLVFLITLGANKQPYHSELKTDTFPSSTLQQRLLPGLIMEQNLLHGSSDNSG